MPVIGDLREICHSYIVLLYEINESLWRQGWCGGLVFGYHPQRPDYLVSGSIDWLDNSDYQSSMRDENP